MPMQPEGPNNAAVQAQNRAAVRQIVKAFNTGDTSLIDDIIHANVETASPCPGVDATFRGGVAQQIEMLREQFPDAVFEEEVVMAEGDMVFLRWKMSGTNTGPIFGRKATGRFITHHGHEIVRFQDGKIVEHVDTADVLEFFDKLGVLDDDMLKLLGKLGARSYAADDYGNPIKGDF